MPTSKEFLSLYEEQKVALFIGSNSMLSLDDISISYKKNKELEKFKEKKPIETLKPGTVDRMREVLKTQGIDEKEIEEHIEKFARRNREIELKSIKR